MAQFAVSCTTLSVQCKRFDGRFLPFLSIYFNEFASHCKYTVVNCLKNVPASLNNKKKRFDFANLMKPIENRVSILMSLVIHCEYVFDECLPQNGIPSGVHCPLSQTRRAGPNSSNPRSHVYVAIVPLSSESSENSTLL